MESLEEKTLQSEKERKKKFHWSIIYKVKKNHQANINLVEKEAHASWEIYTDFKRLSTFSYSTQFFSFFNWARAEVETKDIKGIQTGQESKVFISFLTYFEKKYFFYLRLYSISLLKKYFSTCYQQSIALSELKIEKTKYLCFKRKAETENPTKEVCYEGTQDKKTCVQLWRLRLSLVDSWSQV